MNKDRKDLIIPSNPWNDDTWNESEEDKETTALITTNLSNNEREREREKEIIISEETITTLGENFTISRFAEIKNNQEYNLLLIRYNDIIDEFIKVSSNLQETSNDLEDNEWFLEDTLKKKNELEKNLISTKQELEKTLKTKTTKAIEVFSFTRENTREEKNDLDKIERNINYIKREYIFLLILSNIISFLLLPRKFFWIFFINISFVSTIILSIIFRAKFINDLWLNYKEKFNTINPLIFSLVIFMSLVNWILTSSREKKDNKCKESNK